MTIISVCRTPASDGLWHMRPLAVEEAGLAYPLLLASDHAVEPLPAWRARVAGWLRSRPAQAPQHGAMTLRSAAGVIVSLILYRRTSHARLGHARLGTTLVVGLLRTIEPADGCHGLAATLRMAELTAHRHACGAILLRAEPGSAAWRQTSLGLHRLARTAGYARVGEDWLAELADGRPHEAPGQPA